VVSGPVRTVNAAGFPLHAMDATGMRSSFGTRTPGLMPDLEARFWRVLAPRRGGEVWAVHSMNYIIESWNRDGRRTSAFARNVPWFPEWQGWRNHFDRPTARAQPTPPDPVIHHVFEDEAGLLWLVIIVAEENWRPLLRLEPRRPTPRHRDAELFDTIVEVIDPARREVLVHARLDLRLYSMGNGYLYSYHEDDIGVPHYRIWRMRLQR
jgi:hypothetical protein